MYSLSISTSGKYISVAIHDDNLISSSSVLSENGTTNLLMKSIDEITKKSGIEKSDINVVYLDIGPGYYTCLLYTSPSPRDATLSRMPSSA